jgi:cytochrome P450
VTSYDLAKQSLTNPQFAASRNNTYFGMLINEEQEELQPLNDFFHQWMLFSDPPYHDKLKSLVKASFTPKFVSGFQQNIRDIIGNTLEPLVEARTMDVVQDFATPLSVDVISSVLGVSKNDYLKILDWTERIIGFMGTGRPQIEKGRAAMEAYGELRGYLARLFEQKLAHPSEDLISNLVLNQSANNVSDNELIAVVANILIDGHEPSSLSLSNGINAFIDNPDQLKLLVDDPSLVSGAVDEVLRFDPPFSYSGRRTTSEVILGDIELMPDQRVLFLLGAANRDPNHFQDPNKFNILRNPNKHLTFGYGTHYCLGSALAKSTLSEALLAFSQRVQDPAKLAKPNWRSAIGYRAFDNLPIIFN